MAPVGLRAQYEITIPARRVNRASHVDLCEFLDPISNPNACRYCPAILDRVREQRDNITSAMTVSPGCPWLFGRSRPHRDDRNFWGHLIQLLSSCSIMRAVMADLVKIHIERVSSGIFFDEYRKRSFFHITWEQK